MTKLLHIRIYGRVQNIGFRYSARQTALKYEINGYAKNEPDGSVTIVAEGEEDMLDKFVEWCRNGPSWARVDQVLANEEPVMNYKFFEIK
jgi:acylphosphatase